MNIKEIFKKTILDNPYILHSPTIKQAEALIRFDRELFYGGAGGGGKTDFLLMAALQFIQVPNYASLILMRNFPQLVKPEALLDRAREWLEGTDAVWQEKSKSWFFPFGSRLDFGYLQFENDKYQYKTSAYQNINFDEVTLFTETQYTYLFTRLRRLAGIKIPLRVRSAANPDGPGVIWVKRRFVDKGLFIPAKLTDNPYIDQKDYIESLSHVDAITRDRIQEGKWILSTGEIFKREWFGIINDYHRGGNVCRYWDLAATEQKNSNDPDYAVGGKFTLQPDKKLIVLHRIKVRDNPGALLKLMKQTADIDGKETYILVEQEPGSGGKIAIEAIKEKLIGYAVYGIPSTGSKITRAAPVSTWAFDGKVKLMQADWNEDFLDTLEVFPNGSHDDDVDVLSGGFNWLIEHMSSGEIISGGSGINYEQARIS